MPTTIKRISIALTKEDLRRLEELMKYMGDTKSQVMKQALACYYYEFNPADKPFPIEKFLPK